MSRLFTPFGAAQSSHHWLFRAILLAFGCYLGASCALWIPGVGAHLPVLWPPTGIALASLLLWGTNLWPAAWLGVFLAHFLGGAPAWLAALLGLGSALGPLLGAIAMQREGLSRALDRRRDLILYALLGAGVAALVCATNEAFWLCVGSVVRWADFPSTWVQIWVSAATGSVLVGIPLLTGSRTALQRAFGPVRWVENSAFLLVAPLAALLAFAASAPKFSAPSALLFLPHLLIFWQATRSGLFAASLTALLCVLAYLTAWPQGLGPVSDPAFTAHAMFLGAYACSLLAPALISCVLTRELASQEHRWQSALDASDTGLGQWDLIRGKVLLSKRWLSLLGHETQHFGTSLAAFWTLVHPDDLSTIQRFFALLHSSPEGQGHAQCRMQTRDGRWRTFALHACVTERDSKRQPVGIINTARDITEEKSALDRQDLSESLFQHLHEGLLITDAQLRVLEANPTFSQITGYSREALLNEVPSLLRPAEPGSEAAAHQLLMRAALDEHGSWRGEVRHVRKDGEPCLLQVTVSVVRDANGVVRNHVLAISDMTKANQHLEQLQRQAHFDELTQLPNRVRLAQMLQSAMETSKREGSLLTVCYLDLDHFKPVNDQYGHEAGDRLLVELAERMRRSLRSWAGGDDVVARIGGDEFVLLLRTTTLDESRYAVERVLNQICHPYGLGPNIEPVMITASIGATVFPLDSADAETLLRHADHAMYGAKQAGRNGYSFFDAEHDRRAEARFVALGRIQDALDAQEFRLYFQPKVDMRTSKVLGVEALLRWRHPEQGVVSPSQFLPLIENTGLSISVGNWVLQEGIARLAEWLDEGLDITVSVNVSARHLQEPLFAQHLAGLLSRHPPAVAQQLVIEVLETTALADVEYTCSLMQECRSLGVRFALDDFGTGYSTFTYLKRLPIDMLKIDRSFITHMLSDRQDLAIVEGVIGLSQTFGCSVVAEGVETPEQAHRLIEIGCHVGQGNGIAAAMPPEQFAAWARNYAGLLNAGDTPTP